MSSILDGVHDYYRAERRRLFAKAKRIVVKVGSAVLTGPDGISAETIENLTGGISSLHNSGREIILVTSGAVAAGVKKINFCRHQELSIKQKQALAAIGQSRLMHDYDEAFGRHGKTIAQILLTHNDLANRRTYLNIRNTILTLFTLNVIPVINENDTVSTEELNLSDNDNLGALVANIIEADMFVCLTDVDALYDRNPMLHPEARAIHTVPEITQEILDMAGNSQSAMGTGGMLSKILAAKKVSTGGGSSFIGPGRRHDILQSLFAGQEIGTFFLPSKEKMQSRKRWIAYVLKPRGTLTLDSGACLALKTRGKSLLPSGITRIEGDFDVGDSVRCVGADDTIIAVGLVNYRSQDLDRIKGLHTNEIEKILGKKEYDEVMHRDNLVLI